MSRSYGAGGSAGTSSEFTLQTIEGTGADLRAESGRYLDVRVELRSSPEGESPALHGVSVGRMCTN